MFYKYNLVLKSKIYRSLDFDFFIEFLMEKGLNISRGFDCGNTLQFYTNQLDLLIPSIVENRQEGIQ